MSVGSANPERGEVAVELVTPSGARKTFHLRATFAAVIEIEQRTGLGLLALARKAARLDLGYGESAAILTAGLKAAGESAEYDTVGRMLFDTGLAEVMGHLTDFLAGALSAGEPPGDDAGEARAADG